MSKDFDPDFNLRVGVRIRLLRMVNDPNPIERGSEGTITYVTVLDDWTQLGVEWDNGRTLSLCLPEDKIEII